jgi:hypothetical protein
MKKLRDSTPRNNAEWKSGIFQKWTFRIDACHNHKNQVAPMPNRLQEVIKKDGWTTQC